MKYRGKSDWRQKIQDDRNMAARAQAAGSVAFTEGVSQEDCPYKASGMHGVRRTLQDKQRSSWLFGWLLAKEKADRENKL